MATNNALNNQSTNAFSQPGNASFRGFVTATSAGVTGNGTSYDVASYTEEYDVGAGFNPTTGVFTVPAGQAGKYIFTANIAMGSLGAGATAGNAQFNGTGGAFIDLSNWGVRRNAATNQLVLTGTITCDLAVGNTMKLTVQESNTGADTITVVGGAGNTVFTGQRVA